MENGNNFSARFKSFWKVFFTKNIFLKVISLIFAMLLWGYLLMDQNPVRSKVVQSVDVNIEGVADLIARKLVIVGDLDDQLQDVSVLINTELTKYADLSADDITATVNLKSVNSAGEYQLAVSAYSSEGDAVSVSPATVKIEVDNLVTRRIPVEVSLIGELPTDYWGGTASLGRTELEIEGAKSEVSKIVKAVCEIDLTDRTESIYQSMDVKLLDEKDDEVVPTSLLSQLPSVTARMEILKTKMVPLNIEDAILGADTLPINYEITDITSNVDSVSIAGTPSIIDEITSLDVNKIDVSEKMESVYADTNIIIPDGVKLLDDATIHVYVTIKEQQSTAEFTSMPIEVRGLRRNMVCTLDTEYSDIALSGRISLVALLNRSNVKLYIDVTDMTAGTYDMHILVDLPNDEMVTEIEKTLSTAVVSVTIAEE